MNPPQSIPPQNPEAQRLFLLQAMGIRSHYPRFQLAGALPSVLADWAQSEVDTGEVDAADVAKNEAVRAESIEPPLAPVPLGPVPLPAAAAPPVAALPVAAAAPAPPVVQAANSIPKTADSLAFQLVLIQATKGLVVCNQIPVLARPGLDRREQLLLDNLLLWLGCSRQPEAVQRHFVWPLPGLGATEPGMAGKILQGFLEQAQQEAGFTRLLMLGSNSVDCLQAQLAAVTPQWQSWYTHSLAELLAQPALKRSTWQHLQTLQAGLRR